MDHQKKNNPATNKQVSSSPFIFGKKNYKWMWIGLAFILLGLVLMIGGRSQGPAVFNEKEMYSLSRITFAPLLIIVGFAIEVYALFVKSEK